MGRTEKDPCRWSPVAGHSKGSSSAKAPQPTYDNTDAYGNQQAFANAIRAAGMDPPALLEPGRFYRFPGAEKGRLCDVNYFVRSATIKMAGM